MTTIKLTTEIEAAIETCFDLARDIDAHKHSATNTNEKVIAGKTNGLCELGDVITWEATHFAIKQKLTVKITSFKRPFYFEDKMLKGAFKSMRHVHRFEEINGKTIMSDNFEYEVPYSVAGWLFDKLVLKNYMTKFLVTRNQFLKTLAENRSNNNFNSI